MFISMLLAAAALAVHSPPVHVITVDYSEHCGGSMLDKMARDRLDQFARKRKAEYERQGYKVYIHRTNPGYRQRVFQAGNNRLSDKAPVYIMDNGCL